MEYRFRRPRANRPPRARRVRRTVAVLPTLFTLGNLLCGFTAVHYAAKGDPQMAAAISNYAISGYLIFAAMLFDMLDGRMARLARATTDFGGELDSLADVVSFGIAPAFLTLQVISVLISKNAVPGEDMMGPLATNLMGRLCWIIASIYVSCTALRLARFNIHNRHSEESHMIFRGLPSPGAAGVVAASVIFFETTQPAAQHMLPFNVPGWFSAAVRTVFPYAMPAILLIVALFMVSRFAYPHVINQYLRGRKPFRYVARLVIVGILLLWQPQITVIVGIYFYAFATPVVATWRRISRRHGTASLAPAAGPAVFAAAPRETPADIVP